MQCQAVIVLGAQASSPATFSSNRRRGRLRIRYLFAMFERKRAEMTALVEQLKQWQA
jgi:hypothetical protein